MQSTNSQHHRAYWRANLRILVILLCLWATASFVLSIFLVEPLNRFRVGGFPLGFWFAQQGAIYVFVALIFVYAKLMDRLDARFNADTLADSRAEGRS